MVNNLTISKKKNFNISRKSILLRTRLLKLLNFLSNVVLFSATWFWFYTYNHARFAPKYTVYIIVSYTILLIYLLRTYRAYEIESDSSSNIIFSQALAQFISIVLILIPVTIAWHRFCNYSPFILEIVVQVLINIFWLKCSKACLSKYNKAKSTLIIYNDKSELNHINLLASSHKLLNISSSLSAKNYTNKMLEEIKKYDAVILGDLDITVKETILSFTTVNHILCYYIPSLTDIIINSSSHEKFFTSPLLSFGDNRIPLEYAICKRIFDVILSMLLIICLSPIMLIVFIVVPLEDHGPAIFKQKRLTIGKKAFCIYKFRSMQVNAEKDGEPKLAAGNDPRITKIGKFLRKTRLDELPQLFNILIGDMSFVGPRPERPELTEEYENLYPGFSLRLDVKAGLTGYAQVYGRYDTPPLQKLQMDLLYIKHMSFLTDIMILFATLKTVLISDRDGSHL